MSAHTYILMQLASDVKIVNRLPAFSSSSFASASNILERNLIDRQKNFWPPQSTIPTYIANSDRSNPKNAALNLGLGWAFLKKSSPSLDGTSAQ